MNDDRRDACRQTGRGTARRDIAQRRQYAAHRAVLAVDRVSRMAAQASPEQWEHALRWMRVWIAFASSRELKGGTVPRARRVEVGWAAKL
jgi:hypothetical protein